MIRKGPQLQMARSRAAQVLQDYGLDRLPVDPIALAQTCDILVEPKPPQYDGFSGMLARVGESFGILYATYVPSLGFQRFSVAHELGHYFLDGHVDQLLGRGPHVSKANFTSSDPYELEADTFAAALLMPEALFKLELSKRDEGLATVLALADLCQTSATATAVSYAQHTRAAVAVVQSTDGIVDFCVLSEAMKDGAVGWIKRGDPIPMRGATRSIASNRSRVDAGARDVADVRLNTWFERATALPLQEEAVGLGRYGKVLTVLHCERLSMASDGFDDEEESEDELIERWTPKFK